MSNQIEPPVLLSRMLIFVFAASVVVATVLGITLYKIFPLNRPQVFFLLTQPQDRVNIRLADFSPDETDENFNLYVRAFIREYIKARNEIFNNAGYMQKKWANDENGLVRVWSTDQVYEDFTKTKLWNALITDVPDLDFVCPVEFQKGAVTPRKIEENLYAVSFRQFCANNDGQIGKKDYTIVIRLELDKGQGQTSRWAKRMNNPLGLRVAEYRVESGPGDPLDTVYLADDVSEDTDNE